MNFIEWVQIKQTDNIYIYSVKAFRKHKTFTPFTFIRLEFSFFKYLNGFFLIILIRSNIHIFLAVKL